MVGKDPTDPALHPADHRQPWRHATADRADAATPVTAVKLALRSLARRHQHMSVEITDLDELLEPVVAGQLLVSAGENHDRITGEATFTMLCGVAPIPASSGKTTRHRLNPGGDRQANAALYRVALCRLRWDSRTRDYMQRRTKDELSKKEIIRFLKRYVVRELYQLITSTDLDLAA